MSIMQSLYFLSHILLPTVWRNPQRDYILNVGPRPTYFQIVLKQFDSKGETKNHTAANITAILETVKKSLVARQLLLKRPKYGRTAGRGRQVPLGPWTTGHRSGHTCHVMRYF